MLRSQLRALKLTGPRPDGYPAPADEAIVDRLGWPIGRRRIAPAQAVADHEQDAAQHSPVIDPRNPVRQRKIRFDPAHLRIGQQQQIIHGDTSCRHGINQRPTTQPI
eukprot:TRINITY_DN54639_c0_g1_i1.p1 TRINITY_DN54639_c0_g1~~TRINITY_DN54639_c0_g1_i1.p1  ORF type:complete len:107 (-),score=4.23 TRINITY_DN54639_c0_g1_i1:84-404(-)